MEENPLSERELEILASVATGATNAQVAQALRISANTVKVHLRNIYAKLGVESRTEATTLAIRMGWIRVQYADAAAEAGRDGGIATVPRRSKLAVWRRIFLAGAGLLAVASMFISSDKTELGGDPFVDHAVGFAAPALRTVASRWVGAPPMTNPRARLALVGQGDRLFAIGGDSALGVTGAVEEFVGVEGRWEQRADKPTPAANIGAVELGGRIFVPGGYGRDGEALRALEIYEPAQDRWSEGAPMPEPRFGYAIALLAGEVYVIGGSDGEDYVTKVLIYDPSSDEWRSGPSLPGQPRGFLGAASIGEQVFAVGGFDAADDADLCAVLRGHPEGLRWSECAPMLARRAGHAVVEAGGYLYVVGGGWESYLYFSERYDPAADSWTSFETPILGQWRTLGAASVRRGGEVVLHAVGGWRGGYVASNEVYRPFYYINLPIIP